MNERIGDLSYAHTYGEFYYNQLVASLTLFEWFMRNLKICLSFKSLVDKSIKSILNY